MKKKNGAFLITTLAAVLIVWCACQVAGSGQATGITEQQAPTGIADQTPIPLSEQVPSGVPKVIPHYVLVWRQPDLRSLGIDSRAWVNGAKPFQTLEQALSFAEESELDESTLIGIWQLGEPVRVTLTVNETEETVHKSTRKWKRP